MNVESQTIVVTQTDFLVLPWWNELAQSVKAECVTVAMMGQTTMECFLVAATSRVQSETLVTQKISHWCMKYVCNLLDAFLPR